MSNEKRQFTRVQFPIHASISYQGGIIDGDVTDLSMQGFFVLTQAVLPKDEDLTVTLKMQGTNPSIELRFGVTVVRVGANGAGLKICESDIQSFTHLRNVVAMHLEDPDRVLDEFLP
jgi:hypothetical protein